MLRVAIAQFRPRKGAYEENLGRVGELFRRFAASPTPPDLLAFPEAALTGYFLEGGVQEFAIPAEQLFEDLARVHRASGAPPMEIVTGFYELWRTRLHNSALAAGLGGSDAGIRHIHRKIFLPTYGVFDEERFVEPGRSVQAYDARFGRAAVIVCEDAWHSLVPTIAALDGAQVLVVPGASPARGLEPDAEGDSRPGSARRWERTVQAIAAEHGLYMVVAQLAGFEGGKALQGGSSVVGPRGEVLARGPLFEEAVVEVEIDLEEIVRARAESPMLSDLEMRLPHLVTEPCSAGRERRRAFASRPRRRGFARFARRSAPGSRTAAIRSASIPGWPGPGWSNSFATKSSAGAGSSGSWSACPAVWTARLPRCSRRRRWARRTSWRSGCRIVSPAARAWITPSS